MDYERDKESMRETFELYIKYMEKALGRKGRLLDVGCATGYFMTIAKNLGWEVEGIEISKYATSVGSLKGLTIYNGVLEDVSLPEHSFDAVTLFDVVEHLRDPKSTVLQAKRLLKEGGIIAVTTPDTGGLWAKMLGPWWHLVSPPEHLVLFNRNNFSDLIARIGFSPLIVMNLGKRFTLAYIFQTLFHWQGLSIWRTLARIANREFLAKLKIPINLRDTFFVIAKN